MKPRPVITAIVLGMVAVTAAVAQNMRASGDDAARAVRTAIDATDGAWATVEHSPERAAPWDVHVTRADGSKADVTLDGQFRVTDVHERGVRALAANSTSDGTRESETDDAETNDGTKDVETNDEERPVPKADADRAAEAALQATGGGTVQDVDREAEGGATWEVEVTRPDGKAVEVLLDEGFRVLSVGDEQESNEGKDDADDGEDRDNDRDDD